MADIGDVDADGYDDLVVGAPGLAIAPGQIGVAVVVSGRTGLELYRVESTEAAVGYASSVGVLGDVSGDGIPDFAVGAPFFGSGPVGPPGRVFVYSGSDGAPLFSIDGTGSGSYFGWSILGVADRNADGVGDICIGAFFESSPSGPDDVGAVHYFSGVDGSTIRSLYGDERFALFGFSIANIGDVDGDGVEDLAVGSPGRGRDGFAEFGAAFFHSGRTDSLLCSVQGAVQFLPLGFSVGTGDLNGDGRADALVGAVATLDTLLTARGAVIGLGWVDVASSRAFTFPTEGQLSLGAGEEDVTVRLEPVGANFAVTESVLPSFRIWSPHMLYDQVEVNVAGATVGLDVDGNGVGELALPFSRQRLRDLVSGLPSPGALDTLLVEGRLQGGRRARGTLSLIVHLLDIPRVTVAPNPGRDSPTVAWTIASISRPGGLGEAGA
jgi:hypothetical protein